MNKELKIEEIREIQLNILRYVDDICRKNNLNYFVVGGTLIGTIRHKGYIPWDDDIDIGMPMKDYKKLIQIINSDKDNKYLMLNPYEHANYYYTFSKIVDTDTNLIENNFNKIENMGVFIDVFPLYNLPEDENELKEFEKELRNKEKVLFRNYGFEKYYYDKNIVRKLIKAIVYFPEHIMLKNSFEKVMKDIIRTMERYEEIETNAIGSIIPPCSIKNAMRKEVYVDSTEFEFEGMMIKAPIGYEEYLKKVFGNYMELPPEEERISVHNFKAYTK